MNQFSIFVVKKATQEEARKMCCSLGANLLSVKNSGKSFCMSRMAKFSPKLEGEWWTSGTDKGCDGNFRWCSVDRAFIKDQAPPWAKDHPMEAKGDCVTLTWAGKLDKMALKTENCTAKKRFACEVNTISLLIGTIYNFLKSFMLIKNTLCAKIYIFTAFKINFNLQLSGFARSRSKIHQNCVDLLSLSAGKMLK